MITLYFRKKKLITYFIALIAITLIIAVSCSKKENSNKANKHKIFAGWYVEDTITHRFYDNNNNLRILDIIGRKDSIIDNMYIKDIHETDILYLSFITTNNEWESYLSPRLRGITIYDSKSLVDTTLNIGKLDSLECIYMSDNDFNLVLRDTLKLLKNLSISISNDKTFRSQIDANLYPQLETLMINCEHCSIELPKKNIKWLDIKTNVIDTSYKNIEEDKK